MPAFALQRSDTRIENEMDAPRAMQIRVEAGDHRRHHPAHQPVGRFQHGHGLAQQSYGGGDLQPDEPAADDDDLARTLDPSRQLLRMLERAQIHHAVELRAGKRQRPNPRARRQHQHTVWDALAAGPS